MVRANGAVCQWGGLANMGVEGMSEQPVEKVDPWVNGMER